MSMTVNSKAKKYNVGGGEMLTVREIARIAGTTAGTIRARLRKGWKGDSLVLPLGERRKEGQPRYPTQIVAYKLAMKFRYRVPTVEEIRAVHPMSEHNARFWRYSMRRAIEELT